MRPLFSPCRHLFARDCTGVAAIEFALILPLLLALGLGVVEITRFVITNQKVDNASTSIANVISDLNSSDTELNDATYAQIEANALQKLLGSYGNNTARLQVLMVQKDEDGNPFVSYSYPAGLALPALNGIDLDGRETVIVSNIIMDYTPLLPGLFIPGFGEIINGGELTKTAYFRTRSSLRTGISPEFELDLTTVRSEFPPNPPPPPTCWGCHCTNSCNPPPDPEPAPKPAPQPPCTYCDCPGYPACPPPPPPPPPKTPPKAGPG